MKLSLFKGWSLLDRNKNMSTLLTKLQFLFALETSFMANSVFVNVNLLITLSVMFMTGV